MRKNQQILRPFSPLLTIVPVWLSFFSPITLAAEKSKNVLIFFIDDLRPELACYGADYIKSPHIDKLAAEGTLFERAYCQQGICAPSRISMMTGLYPDTVGIYSLWTPVRKALPEVMTLPRYFTERGYVTASYGKVYHHGSDDEKYWAEITSRPGQRYANPETHASVMARRKEARRKKLQKTDFSSFTAGPAVENADVADEVYQDGAVAQQAIQSLRRNKDKPFFICVGFAKPHLPFAAPKRYWDLYEREQFKVPKREVPSGSPGIAITQWGELRSYQGIPKEGPLSDEQTKELMHGYAASVSFADAQVGKVMGALKRLGLRENTVVVLWGDHGYKIGEYGAWCKHTNFELDARVPFLISAPSFPKGKRTESLVEMVDIFPTVAHLSGGEIPSACEGQNLEAILRDSTKQVRPFAYTQYARGNGVGFSMRDERWRYTEWLHPKSHEVLARELYDHETSSIASENLAENTEYQELVTRLSAMLNSQTRIKTRAKNPLKERK